EAFYRYRLPFTRGREFDRFEDLASAALANEPHHFDPRKVGKIEGRRHSGQILSLLEEQRAYGRSHMIHDIVGRRPLYSSPHGPPARVDVKGIEARGARMLMKNGLRRSTWLSHCR